MEHRLAGALEAIGDQAEPGLVEFEVPGDLDSSMLELAKQFGSKNLEPHQVMKLERVSMLYGEVTKYEAIALQVEAGVKVLKKKIEVLEATEGAVSIPIRFRIKRFKS